MKKRIAVIIIGIIILIGIIAIIILATRNGKYTGYGIKYEIPNDYKFIITQTDTSAVDGVKKVYYIYEDKIIWEATIHTPNSKSVEVILYEDVDTSNIEYKEDEGTNAIIQGNSESLKSIEEAIQDKEGKTVCNYTENFD